MRERWRGSEGRGKLRLAIAAGARGPHRDSTLEANRMPSAFVSLALPEEITRLSTGWIPVLANKLLNDFYSHFIIGKKTLF